jgi:hypothetical protein
VTDYGLDLGDALDLDPMFAPVSGPRAVLLAVARRFLTPRGALDYDPDFGLDVRDWLSAALDPREADALGRQLAAEAEKDERVRSAAVAVTREGDALRIACALTLGEGIFRLVLSVDRVDAVFRED